MKKSETEERADILLYSIRDTQREIARITSAADEEIEKVRMKYQRHISVLQEKLQGLDREIVGLMKSNKKMFEGRDKISLTNGFLLHAKEMKVSLPRDILKRIEDQGWEEGYRVLKSIDRPAIEKWDDEKLSIVGGKRKPVKKFAYEVIGDT